MNGIAWYPVMTMVVIASIADLRSRRIPNWLVLPFLAGGLCVSAGMGGFSGFGQSIAGLALAVLATGIPVFLRGMGMGDLKLCAAVGAWVGPAQLAIALVVTGIAGGIMAVVWAAFRGKLGESLDRVNNLVAGIQEPRRSHLMTLGSPAAFRIPYAPAIAIGTAFSFFTQ